MFIEHFLRLTIEPFVLNLEVFHLKRYEDDEVEYVGHIVWQSNQ